MFQHFEPPFSISRIVRLTIKYAGIPPDNNENNTDNGNTINKITFQSNSGNITILPNTLSIKNNLSIKLHIGITSIIPPKVPNTTRIKFSTKIDMNIEKRPCPQCSF